MVGVTDIDCLRHIYVNMHVCEQQLAYFVCVVCTTVLFYLSYQCQSSSTPPPHTIHHHGNQAKYLPPSHVVSTHPSRRPHLQVHLLSLTKMSQISSDLL